MASMEEKNQAWEIARKALEKTQMQSQAKKTAAAVGAAGGRPVDPRTDYSMYYYNPYAYYQQSYGSYSGMANYSGYNGGQYYNMFHSAYGQSPCTPMGGTQSNGVLLPAVQNCNEQGQPGMPYKPLPPVPGVSDGNVGNFLDRREVNDLDQGDDRYSYSTPAGHYVPRQSGNNRGPPKSKQAPGAGSIKFNLQKRPHIQQPVSEEPTYVNDSGNNNGHNCGNNVENDDSFSASSQQPMPRSVCAVSNSQEHDVSYTRSGNSMELDGQNGTRRNAEMQQLSNPPQPRSGSGEDSWPENLKNYVNRAFAKCVMDVDKDQVQIYLKGTITKAFQEGSVWTKDWDNEPLPSVYSESLATERQQQQQGSKIAVGTGSRQVNAYQVGSNSGNNNNSGRAGVSGRNRFVRRDRSRSRTRSRSRSRSPYPRRRKRRSSHSSESSSSSGSPWSKNAPRLSSSIVGPTSSSSSSRNFIPLKSKGGDGGFAQNSNAQNKKKRKKNNKKKVNNGSTFTVDEDLATAERLQKRAARFNDGDGSKKQKMMKLTMIINNCGANDESNEIDWSNLTISGTCQDLEKPYLRLTTAPDASTVRPVEVLKESLQMVKEHWLKKHDYHYVCDQLKSIRQDLTVQCKRDEFAIHVYETHARVALEKGDHEEFNQCQTQLKALYSEIGGENRMEFMAYRIIYCIFTANTLDLTTILASLTPIEKHDECIRHALELRSAWALNNYNRFFRLYKDAPKMSGYLIDWFVDRERKNALKAMVKSYVLHSVVLIFVLMR